MSEVVITGVGVVSPFGIGLAPFFAGLRAGGCAVGPIRHFDASALPVQVAGEVPLPFRTCAPCALPLMQLCQTRLGIILDERSQAALYQADHAGALADRKVVFATLAALEAWRDAGCGEAERRAPSYLGLGLELGLLDDLTDLLDAQGGGPLDFDRDRGEPLVRLRAPVDLGASVVRRLLGLQAAAVVNVSACAAGALAIADAAALIRRGHAQVVLCGGADSMVNPLGLGGMARLGAPSPRAAADACRPFDRRRDGLVIGEGAALFVLEAAERAAARGARVYARVLGWGSTQDGYRVTAPRPDGSQAARAMQQALRRAGVSPDGDAVGYINAHGTGTPLNDPAEAHAIAAVFGDRTPELPVSSIKGAVGHLMAAAGALELAACLLAFTDDLLPGTAHHREPDPDCPIRVLGPGPQPARIEVALSNSFGFGGQNACLAIGRPRP